MLAFRFSAVAGTDENTPLYPRIPAALKVDQLVPDQVTLSQIHPQLVPGIKQKLRGRLSTAARDVGGFRRKINPVDPRSGFSEFIEQPFVDPLNIGEREVATADAGLV